MDRLTIQIHHENGSLWATVAELPGVFATGEGLDELQESLAEGVSLVLERDVKLDFSELNVSAPLIAA